MRRVPALVRRPDIHSREAEGFDNPVAKGGAGCHDDVQAAIIFQLEAIQHEVPSRASGMSALEWQLISPLFGLNQDIPISMRRRLNTKT